MRWSLIVVTITAFLFPSLVARAKDNLQVTAYHESPLTINRPFVDTRIDFEVPFTTPEHGALRSNLGIVDDFEQGQHIFRAYAGPRLRLIHWANLTIQSGVIAGWFGPWTAGILAAAEFELDFSDALTEINIRIHGYFNNLRADLHVEIEALAHPHPFIRLGFLIEQSIINEQDHHRLGPTLGISAYKVIEVKLSWIFDPGLQANGLRLTTAFHFPRPR